MVKNEKSDSDLVRTLATCSDEERKLILLTLYERYKLLVLKICYHYLADYDQANDVFHDIFIKVIENAENLKNPSVFKSWLLTITRNLCVDRLRKTSLLKEQEPLTAQVEVISGSRTEDRYIAEMDRQKILVHLSGCIKGLTESNQTILKLRWRGLKAGQILKILKIEKAELRRSYDSIKKDLETCMERKGHEITIDQIISLGELE
jgi:RNA polymerase sigma-70 factor (ECF subfamily)